MMQTIYQIMFGIFRPKGYYRSSKFNTLFFIIHNLYYPPTPIKIIRNSERSRHISYLFPYFCPLTCLYIFRNYNIYLFGPVTDTNAFLPNRSRSNALIIYYHLITDGQEGHISAVYNTDFLLVDRI